MYVQVDKRFSLPIWAIAYHVGGCNGGGHDFSFQPSCASEPLLSCENNSKNSRFAVPAIELSQGPMTTVGQGAWQLLNSN